VAKKGIATVACKLVTRILVEPKLTVDVVGRTVVGRSVMKTDGIRNRLLRLLEPKELADVLSRADRVELRRRQILHHWRMPMHFGYFMESGLVSVSAKVSADEFVETWLIGSEGMVGLPFALLEHDPTPPHRRVVQVGGTAFRIRADDFRVLLSQLPGFRRVVHRYLDFVLFLTSQTGACNSFHVLKERLSRWLLLASDCLASNTVPLTHEVMAHLLGVRRASVSECLETLEQEGGIVLARSAIMIVDEGRLQANCCVCFRLIEKEYARLLVPQSPDLLFVRQRADQPEL
jgi:CRP-like cAMP-binding protein